MEYSTAEFEALYRQCFPHSLRLAMGLLHDEDEARDVVQEVFVRLWESDIRPASPAAFLVRSVRNACINKIGRMDTRDRIRQRIALEQPPDDCDADERSDEMKSAMHRLLTPREREVVDRLYAEGMSYKEAAENLGVSVAAINKNVVSALKKLRNHFKTDKS